MWCDERIQRLHKYPGRKALRLGQTPRIHLKNQKDLLSGKRKGKAMGKLRERTREKKVTDFSGSMV